MIFLENSMRIFPDKSQFSSTTFLRHLVDERPYTIEVIFLNNGTEYKGTLNHEFVKACRKNIVTEKQRVIRTMMEEM